MPNSAHSEVHGIRLINFCFYFNFRIFIEKNVRVKRKLFSKLRDLISYRLLFGEEYFNFYHEIVSSCLNHLQKYIFLSLLWLSQRFKIKWEKFPDFYSELLKLNSPSIFLSNTGLCTALRAMRIFALKFLSKNK